MNNTSTEAYNTVNQLMYFFKNYSVAELNNLLRSIADNEGCDYDHIVGLWKAQRGNCGSDQLLELYYRTKNSSKMLFINHAVKKYESNDSDAYKQYLA